MHKAVTLNKISELCFQSLHKILFPAFPPLQQVSTERIKTPN